MQITHLYDLMINKGGSEATMPVLIDYADHDPPHATYVVVSFRIVCKFLIKPCLSTNQINTTGPICV